MIRHRPFAVCTVCALACVLAACAGEEKKVVAPAPPMPTSDTTITSAPTETKPVSPTIAVSEDIARACSLHFDDVVKAPKFDFDRSDLLPADHDVLAKIGECAMSGPLAGRTLQLVGRADPRGTQQYNMALGARRAHSVAAYLEHLGLAPARLRETSRGELDATGTDEASWQVDRRVDIVLGE
jgi:peptidoglycan-associated lipoprotein